MKPADPGSTDIDGLLGFSEGLQLAGTILRTSHEAVVITDSQGIIVTVNQAFTITTGYSEEDVVGPHASSDEVRSP